MNEEERRRLLDETQADISAGFGGDEYAAAMRQTAAIDEAYDDASRAAEQRRLFEEEGEAQARQPSGFSGPYGGVSPRASADEDFGEDLYRTAMNVPMPERAAQNAPTDPEPYGRAPIALPEQVITVGEPPPPDDMTFTEAEAYPDAPTQAPGTWDMLTGTDEAERAAAAPGPAAPTPPMDDEYAAAMAPPPSDTPAMGPGGEPFAVNERAITGPIETDAQRQDMNLRAARAGRADERDLFRGLGVALAGLGGNPAPAIDAWGERRRTEAAAGEAREQRGAQQRRDDAREAERRALDERRVQAQEAGVGIRQSAEARQQAQTPGRIEARRQQNAQRARQNATAEDMQSPDSAVSMSFQDSLRASRERMPPEMRERLSDDALSGMSAQMIEDDPALAPYLSVAAARTRPEQRSRVAGEVAAGGGGGTARAAAREAFLADRVLQLTERGMEEAEARGRAEVEYASRAGDDVALRGLLNTGASQEGTRERITATQLAVQRRQLGTDLADIGQYNRAVTNAGRLAMDLEPGEIQAVQVALSSGVTPGALSERGQRFYQALARAHNIVIKDRSGAAVTASEWDRMRAEMGRSLFGGPDMIMNWLRDEADNGQQNEIAFRAAYADEVNDAYDAGLARYANRPRGGAGDGAPAAGGAVRVRTPSGRLVELPAGAEVPAGWTRL